jgi:hypothetical protein
VLFQVGTLRKRYNVIISRMESRDIERNDLEKEVKDLNNRQSELIDKLDHFRLSTRRIFRCKYFQLLIF